MNAEKWLNWFEEVLKSVGKATEWLTQPLLGTWLSPIVLFSFAGISVYLTIAIVKWGIR